MHPSMVMLAGLEIPYGKNEIEAAGGILGAPVDVVRLPKTGLPVPANSEIAFEGFIHPDDMLDEGPLGEWTGYTPIGSHPAPAIRLATLTHRNNPILMGAIPAVPPNDNTYYLGTYRAGAIWNQMEAAGLTGINGVWTHEAGGSRFMTVVSIKQLYGGHSKQAGMIAAHCLAGAFCNRWTIVVDDDIDPTNFNDVVWAMCTRFDPRHQLEIVHGGWSSSLDPMCYDARTDRRNSRLIVDACIPFHRRSTFPPIARSSKELDDRMRKKWKHELPEGF
jgi:4-hydroxy-3-polyprenylbenzoate decarboxylase